MGVFKINATIASFSGQLLKLTHESSSTGTSMNLNLYLPPLAHPSSSSSTTASQPKSIPLLIYLAGLTCTEANGAEKSFLQHRAAHHNLAIAFPDTSPRGLNLPGEHDAWDFGSGAGFYVDATADPWSTAYRMHSYVADELPKVLAAEFAVLDTTRLALAGHSMGGHGALTLFLKHPGRYRCVSAFAPIANPSRCPWGEKAFKGYFGDDAEARKAWAENDATELLRGWKGDKINALIDVGTDDQFYKQGQLLPENFAEAAKQAGQEEGIRIRYQEGYDHSYYFISSFADEHVDFAAKFLNACKKHRWAE